MADLAELAMEGVPLVAEHYDKVTDPLKDKTKQGYQRVKTMKNNRRRQTNDSDDDSYEYDGPPRRAQTEGRDRRRRSGSRRRSGRGDVIEERRVVTTTSGGRAKSVGRDDYYTARGGRGDRRKGNYESKWSTSTI